MISTILAPVSSHKHSKTTTDRHINRTYQSGLGSYKNTTASAPVLRGTALHLYITLTGMVVFTTLSSVLPKHGQTLHYSSFILKVFSHQLVLLWSF